MPFDSAPVSQPGRLPLVPRVHDFRASLALSESYSDAPWWMILYRKAFPSLVSAVSVRDDGWAQRGGMGRVLTHACSGVCTVDEKVRSDDRTNICLRGMTGNAWDGRG